MHHGGRDDHISRAGTPRHSTEGHYMSPKSVASNSGSPRSEPGMHYPTYDYTPTSISGATEMDYDYEERDFGLLQQVARPSISVRLSESSGFGAPSHRSAPAALPNRGYYSQTLTAQFPLSSPPFPPGQQYACVYAPQQDLLATYRDRDQYGDATCWYAGPASFSSHGHFPATPVGHNADPTPFGISAPHHHPGHIQTRKDEVLPSFPQWSKTWYEDQLSPKGHVYAPPAHPEQIGWEPETQGAASAPYGHLYGHKYMTDHIKEERIRMLEKKFGKPKVTQKGGKGRKDAEDVDAALSEYDDDDDDLPMGSVDNTGRLITERPRWNLFLRCLQILMSLIACACGLGGLIFVRTTSNSEPAPKGTYPAYLLYAYSIITLIVLLYFHVFRALCCDPMRKEIQSESMSPFGGMIVPILSNGGGGGKMQKQKKFGKRMQQNHQAPTVNLIVDPSLLSAMGGGKSKRDRNDLDDDDEERLPGDARRSSKRKNGIGVIGNMQLQRRWRLARKTLKLLTAMDVFLCILWMACNVVALGLGKKCPASSQGMWCTLYNITMASGVILAILFAAAIYFDYKDLRVSREAPKPPM